MHPFTKTARAGICVASFAYAVGALAQTETVATNGSFNVNYGTASQASPRVPFTDLGFQATAAISQGTISGNLGGGTNYTLAPGAVTGNELFTLGTTNVSLGYTPGWAGLMSTNATGNLGINFGYHLGPFCGSTKLLSDTIDTGSAGLDFSAALNANGSGSTSTTANGLGIGGKFGVNVIAGLCPFCATIASASLSYSIGSSVTQNLGWASTSTYGDLVWYSKSPNLRCAGLISTDTSIGGIHLDEEHDQETTKEFRRGVQAASGADDS